MDEVEVTEVAELFDQEDDEGLAEEDGDQDADEDDPPQEEEFAQEEPEVPELPRESRASAARPVFREGPPAVANASGEADNVPQREDDLDLEEVPEDQREAVQGNLTLKRLLSSGSNTSGGPAKRRKQGTGGLQQELEPAKAELLKRWRLEGDVALRYVLEAAESGDVQALSRSSFVPRRKDVKKSACEQVNDKLSHIREERYPPGQTVDVVGAFKHRWKLDEQTVSRLRELNHKDLRHVMTEYDGERPIEDVLGEASISMPDEDDMKTVDATPLTAGVLTMGRLNRLELIDPTADALICGDANLTFAELLAKHREGLGHVGRVVATTFESIQICRERYKEIDHTVKIIEDLNGEVLHDVDATRLAVDPRFKGMTGKFGAVYYNFPHAGVVGGFFDGHPFVRWRHENLMHLFFSALRPFVKPGGVVKVASNANATGVRFSDIMMAAEMNEFRHVETFPFPQWQLRGYGRSYGDRRDANRRPGDGENYRSQKANSDMVYMFRFEPTERAPPKPRIRYPPAKHYLLESSEGTFKGCNSQAQRERRIEEIYQLFVSYVEGVHVG